MNIQNTNFYATILKGFLTILVTLIFGGLVQAQTNYSVTIKTGDITNASTDAGVYAKLRGTEGGESNWVRLDPLDMNIANEFQRNTTYRFRLGNHSLKGKIQISFTLLSGNTFDESWNLEWFKVYERAITKREVSRKIKVPPYKNRNNVRKWVHLGQPTPFYNSGLKGQSFPEPINYPIDADFRLKRQTDGNLILVKNAVSSSNFNFTRFTLVPQANGSYRFLVNTDKLFNRLTLTNGSLNCTRISISKQKDGSYRSLNKCTGRLLGTNMIRSRYVSIRYQPKDILTPVVPKKLPKVQFENRTGGPVEIYKVVYGKESLYSKLDVGDMITKTTSENQRWRIKSSTGKYIEDYVATDNSVQKHIIRTPAKQVARVFIQH